MRYDVVVIGAGPAGSTAAKFLSEKGVSVLLLDKSAFPRDKACGGGLPARVIKRYNYIEENALVDSYSYEACLYSTSLKYKVDIQKKEPIVAMVLRDKFDAGLAKLAVNNGAVFLPKRTVEHLKICEENARLVLTDGTKIESSYVIAADGMWSMIGKQLGEHQDNRNIGVCVLQEYPLRKTTLDQFFGKNRCVHIHLNIQGVAGYGWVFPKNKHVNIGICEFRQSIDKRHVKKNIKTVYTKYLQILKESNLIPSTLQATNLKGGVFPTIPVKNTSLKRVVLCGDAAGLTNPLTGEGIYNAMVSGEIAAGVIRAALENGAVTTSNLSRYPSCWKKDFGDNNRRFYFISRHWSMGKDSIVRLFYKDEKLVDLVMDHILTLENRRTLQLKLARRFLSVYLKDRLRAR